MTLEVRSSSIVERSTPSFAQHFLGVLAQARRNPPHPRRRLGKARAGIYRAHGAGIGMLVQGEVFVGDDLFVSEQRLVVVDAADRDVGLLQHFEPLGGRALRERLGEPAQDAADAFGAVSDFGPPFVMPDAEAQSFELLVGERRDRNPSVFGRKRIEALALRRLVLVFVLGHEGVAAPSCRCR